MVGMDITDESNNWRIHELRAHLCEGNPEAVRVLASLFDNCPDSEAQELLELLSARFADGCLDELPEEFWNDLPKFPNLEPTQHEGAYPVRFKLLEQDG